MGLKQIMGSSELYCGGFLFALLGLWALPVQACINAFGTDKDGRRFEAMDYTGQALETILLDKRGQSYWIKSADKIGKKAVEEPTFENLNDIGVVLIYQQNYTTAIRHFLRIEKLFPDRPETAANLGTALELAGYERPASKWIRIGIKRNRGEHFGTEWLHARILSAKIANADGRWQEGRSIAGVQFSDAVVPQIPATLPAGNDGRPVKAHELDRAFRYQLSERMKFVPAPDWVVANLLQDWAMLNLAGGPLENAKVQFRLAAQYGYPQSPLIAKRVERIGRILSSSEDQHSDGFECGICPPIE